MSGDPKVLDEGPGRDIAAEYVLGLLDARERTACETRLAADADFARQVADWDLRFEPWLTAIPSVEPPRALWNAIEQRVAAHSSGKAPSPARARWWDSLAFWRGLSVASLGLAGACAALLLVPRIAAPAPMFVATLSAADGAPAFAAMIDPRASIAVLTPLRTAGAANASHELWLILPGQAPRAMAIFEPGRPQSATLMPTAGDASASPATLAISLEPPGGSPAAGPTGPVIAQGALQKI